MVTVALPKVPLYSPTESLSSRVSNVISFLKELPRSSCNSFYLTAMVEFNNNNKNVNNDDDDDDEETAPTGSRLFEEKCYVFFSSS